MVGKILSIILALLVFWEVRCENPPTLSGSFIAWGEVSQPFSDTNGSVILQLAFEESYDSATQNAAFFLYMAGQNLTFVKNYNTNQTFLYIENQNGTKMRCQETSEQEWVGSDFTAGLLSFEDNDGTVRFSLAQMTNIPEKYLKEEKTRGVATKYRGIPAKSWMHEIKTKDEDGGWDVTLTITSFWSDGNWNTTAGKKVIPLGFSVSKYTASDPPVFEDYIVNVFGFIPNAYDHKYFEPYQGIYCANRRSTVKFPNVKNIRAISLHFETTVTMNHEILNTDMWFDPQNKLVRVDIKRISEVRYDQTEVAIGKMGIVYRWTYSEGEGTCYIFSFDKYRNDIQNLIDITNVEKWQMDKLFGLNETSYSYIGKTLKFGIPCHLFQGIRTDWPDKESSRPTLWEWCFNVNMTNKNDVVMFEEDQFGLVNANVIILEDRADGSANYHMNHHFYEVKKQDPKLLDATQFDISKCYKYAERRILQFYLDMAIVSGNLHIAENATSDVTFLQKWKAAIYEHSGLPEESLRVSSVRATIDDRKLYIKFTILTVHKDLPEEIRDKSLPAFDAERQLRENVDNGKVSIKYNWNKETNTLTAAKKSVDFQIDRDFEPITAAPIIPTEPAKTTHPGFSLRPDKEKTTKQETTVSYPTPESTTSQAGSTANDGSATTSPNDGSTTTSPNDGISTTPKGRKDEKERAVKYTGNQPGAVAGVSIALLLVGISIGSAGTFYKFNGLPECLRR